MKSYKLIVFDLDGVLYRGNEVVHGAPQVVNALKKRGVKVRYLTNNSSQTRSAYAEKLNRMGFNADENEVYSSAYASAKHLRGKTVYVVGEEGLRDEMKQQNVTLIENSEDFSEWVAVGICWNLKYEHIDEAQHRIRNGAKFLATNLDATYPDEGGRVRPGAGAIVAAISESANKKPDIVMGKPEKNIMEMIFEETGCTPDETLLVGDRIDTDILLAQRTGCDSALVLSGVTGESQIQDITPTYVLKSVADLVME